MKRAVDISAALLLGAGPAAVAARLMYGGFMDPMLAGALAGALAAAALLGCLLAARGKLLERTHPALIAMALFAGAALLSSTAARSPVLSLRACAHLIIYLSATYFLFQAMVLTGRARSVLGAAALASGLFSIHALIQFTGRDFLSFQIPFRNDFIGGYQIYSVFGNPNLLGDCLAISFPMIIGLWAGERNLRLRMVYMTCGALTLTALCLTMSRGAILGAAAGAAVFLWARHSVRGRSGAAAAAAVLILATAVCAVLVLGRDQAKSESMRMREITQGVTLLMARDNPILGVGFDRYRHEHLTYQARYFKDPANREFAHLANREKQRHAHNEFLQIPAEMGLIGLAAFLALLGALGWPLARAARGREPDACAAGLLGAGAAFCAAAAFSFPLRVPQTASLLCVLAACAMAISARPAAAADNIYLPLPRIRLEAAVIIILLASLAAWELVLQPYMSVERRLRGEAALRAGNPLPASAECLDAYRLDRFHGEALYCLGLTQLHMNHPEDAAHNFEQALKLIDDPWIRFVYARALRQSGDNGGAEEQLLVMSAMTPEHIAPRLALVSLYQDLDRTRELRAARRAAVEVLEREHERSGPDYNRILDIARLHHALGNKKQYALWLSRAQAMKPAHPDMSRQEALQ